MHEVALLYEAFRAGQPAPPAPLAIQFADYAAWQRQRLQGEYLERLLEYWRERLQDVPPLELPTDQPRSQQASQAGATLDVVLPAALLQPLKELAGREAPRST